MSTVRTTVDDHTYNAANDILGALGMDMNAAVRMFLQGVVLSGGIPFELRLRPDQIAAVRERKEANRNATREGREIAAGHGSFFEGMDQMLADIRKNGPTADAY